VTQTFDEISRLFGTTGREVTTGLSVSRNSGRKGRPIGSHGNFSVNAKPAAGSRDYGSASRGVKKLIDLEE